MKFNKHTFITFGILAGLILGFIIGQLVFTYADADTRNVCADTFKFVGTTFFMNLLKMVLIPLVVSSVVVGVASIGDPAALGKIGGYTMLYYFSTMLIAVILGLVVVNLIRPGVGIEQDVIAKGEKEYAGEDVQKRLHLRFQAPGRVGVEAEIGA